MLTLELQEKIKKHQLNSFEKEKIKNLLREIAWEHITKDDLETAEYIFRIINTSIDKIFWEIGLDYLMSYFDDREKIYEILKIVGIKKSRNFNQLIIRSAAKLIIQGYDLEHLRGLGFLFESQPFDQKIINEVSKLWEEEKETETDQRRERIAREFNKLISFIKEYVFILK